MLHINQGFDCGNRICCTAFDNIDNAKMVLLILSKEANNSPHVLREIEYAFRKNKPVLVYAIENNIELTKSLEYYLITNQWVTKQPNAYEKILEGISNLLKTEQPENIKKVKKPFPLIPVIAAVMLIILVIIILIPKNNDAANETTVAQEEVRTSVASTTAVNKTSEAMTTEVQPTLPSESAESVQSQPVETELVENYTTENHAPETDAPETYESETEVKETEAEETKATIAPTTLAPTTHEPYVDDETEEDYVVPDVGYNIGDIITFGSYYETPIEWLVIKITKEGNLVLLSKDILTMKCYDAAEGGVYNRYGGVDYWSSQNYKIDDQGIQIMARGNNDWSLSNIRRWLNSDELYINYPDQAPTEDASGYNFYYAESGFLYGFTQEEKDMLIPVTNKTRGNIFSTNTENGKVVTTDYVYLLSLKEYLRLPEIGISPYARPSKACSEHNKYISEYNSFVKDLKVESYYYLLRDNSGVDSYKIYMSTTEYESDMEYLSASAGISNFGIRPVVCIKCPGK